MQALSKNKGSLGLATLLIIGIFVYNTFAGTATPSTAANQPAASVGADLLKVSDTLSRATLSRTLFSVSGYRLLTDFSRALVPEPLGRNNPFAPLGQ